MATDDADDDAGKGRIGPDERDAIKRRARELGDRLDEFRTARQPKTKPAGNAGNAFGQALRMAIDPVVGVLVGLGIGLAADNALGTRPLLLIIGLVIGGAAGMHNLIRSAQRVKPGQTKEPNAADKSGQTNRDGAN